MRRRIRYSRHARQVLFEIAGAGMKADPTILTDIFSIFAALSQFPSRGYRRGRLATHSAAAASRRRPHRRPHIPAQQQRPDRRDDPPAPFKTLHSAPRQELVLRGLRTWNLHGAVRRLRRSPPHRATTSPSPEIIDSVTDQPFAEFDSAIKSKDETGFDPRPMPILYLRIQRMPPGP